MGLGQAFRPTNQAAVERARQLAVATEQGKRASTRSGSPFEILMGTIAGAFTGGPVGAAAGGLSQAFGQKPALQKEGGLGAAFQGGLSGLGGQAVAGDPSLANVAALASGIKAPESQLLPALTKLGGPKETTKSKIEKAKLKKLNLDIAKAEKDVVTEKEDEVIKTKTIVDTTEPLIELADTLLADPELGKGTGVNALLGFFPGTKAKNIAVNVKTLTSKQALDKLTEIKKTGATLGQISEKELELLETSVRGLDPGLSDEQFRTNLKIYRDHLADMNAKLGTPFVPRQSEPAADVGTDYLDLLKGGLKLGAKVIL
jgi:hypothetical protein